MIFLKQGLAVLVIATVLFMTACTQDDCVPPAIEQNIIGSWITTEITGNTVMVEFQSNGTLVDSSHYLTFEYINNDTFPIKTYSVSNDTLYTVSSSPVLSTSAVRSYVITKNECDEITFPRFSTSVTFTREE